MWNLPPPPGFQGLREDLPLRVYENILPHWRQEGSTYFATFRLNDSLPGAKLRELAGLKEQWLQKHPPPHSRQLLEKMLRALGVQVEKWLDQGYGSCLLREPELAQCVVAAMLDGGEGRYELGCFVVMPNHVHAVVRPLRANQCDLEEICGLWKGGSARHINLKACNSHLAWQRESHDQIIRDEEHLWRVIQYIGRNPAKANLPADSAPIWINPAWVKLGWKFQR